MVKKQKKNIVFKELHITNALQAFFSNENREENEKK
jgi:hypothetical protein